MKANWGRKEKVLRGNALWIANWCCGAIGECKNVMMDYLSCVKKMRGLNAEECRGLAKSYLGCRMDRLVSPSLPLGGACMGVLDGWDGSEVLRNILANWNCG